MGSLKLPNMIDITARVPDWSTDPPTEDGWYWAMHQDNGGPWLCWVDANDQNLRQAQGVYCIMGYKSGLEAAGFLVSHFTHLLGPLPKPEPPRDDIADIGTIEQEIADFEAAHGISSEEFLSMRAEGKAEHIPHANVWASLCGVLLLSYRVDKSESPR